MFTKLAVAVVALVPFRIAASEGQSLYFEHCASCHGANLEGEPNWKRQNADGSMPAPPHDASGHTWHHDDQTLFNYSKYGGDATLKAMGITGVVSAMPGFSDTLDDVQIQEILTFIKSTWPAELREYQVHITENAK